jgi:hypothetical protein
MSTAIALPSPRFTATLGATSLAALLAAVGLWALVPVADQVARATPRPSSPCVRSAAVGSSERAAGAVIEEFLRGVVVRTDRACGSSSFGVPGLEPARYETRFPARAEGWYQLAPRIRNAKGLWEYAGFLWVDAPDAAPAAFEFLLELHGERWLVSSFRTAPGSAEIDLSKLPT